MTQHQKKMADSLKIQVEASLSKYLDTHLTVLELRNLQGGSINKAMMIRTNQGMFFAKMNDAKAFPNLFLHAKTGLDTLRQTKTLRVPQVIELLHVEDQDILLMEFMESGTPHYDFWEDFGHKLASLHQHTRPQFGFDQDNYIGTLHQNNAGQDHWVEFFICNRLEPMLALAVNAGKADTAMVDRFQKMYKELPNLFPVEAPSLLHGDLWSGNFMADLEGDPIVYDPSVYYGHREMDLAMTRLFGGFDQRFYDAYQEAMPLQPGWENRVAICNLYPLLVHVNLFVGSYIQSVKNIVAQFS